MLILRNLIATLAFVAVVGCSPATQQQVQNTTRAVATEVREGATQAVEVSKEAAAQAEVTVSVKGALLASDKVDTSALNVDTVNSAVYLRGYVPTLEQRTLAEEIANNTVADEIAVVNELAVGVDVTSSSTPLAGATPLPTPGTLVDEAHEHEAHHPGDGHDH
jgi:hypothetical protein